ncbi:hypothetical protein GCM10023172_42200 [Hymenobacter ginsengisoli]|uniref:Uncharacterized protein n=1 Tax=Hymenobacter ginsengisoli TaxID=1051626 RepID=A0ABP8QR17_9BACT|nr:MULTISPECIES: hypothetical protein [unclassified Hymenobacter]MBO2034011.1 hypothetical protein [Hymenobacter sp. BT559]
MRNLYVFFVAFGLVSCNHIETGKTLKKSDLDFIRSIGLLDEGEEIHKFYSELRNKNAGNFFTDKRMAAYWIDDKNKRKTALSSAFYPEIVSIDTVYYAGATYCPYMLVNKDDSTQFKVCAEGKRAEVKQFFEEALNLWKKNRRPR